MKNPAKTKTKVRWKHPQKKMTLTKNKNQRKTINRNEYKSQTENNSDEGGEETAILEVPHPDEPTPTEIKKECRYSVTITVPLSNEPWNAFIELLLKFLKLIHEQASNKMYITTRDAEMEETEKIIKKPKDFPEAYPNTARTTRIILADAQKAKPKERQDVTNIFKSTIHHQGPR
jgi:hypothetical protein